MAKRNQVEDTRVQDTDLLRSIALAVAEKVDPSGRAGKILTDLKTWAKGTGKANFAIPLREDKLNLQKAGSELTQEFAAQFGKAEFPCTLKLFTNLESTELHLGWTPAIGKNGIQTLICCTSYFESVFVDLLLLSLQSEASRFGVNFENHRFNSDESIIAFIEDRESNEKHIAYLVDWRAPFGIDEKRKQLKAKYNIFESVNEHSGVAQNNVRIGQLAAQMLRNDLKLPDHGVVGVVHPMTQYATPTITRRDSFKASLSSQTECIEIQTPDLRERSIMTATIRSVVAAIKTTPSLSAIYATSGDATIASVMALESLGKTLPVIGTDFLPDTISLLSEPDSLLQGIVGVDPHSYGIIKSHLCLNNLEKLVCGPVTIFKSDYLNNPKRFRSMHEFSERYMHLFKQNNGAEFEAKSMKELYPTASRKANIKRPDPRVVTSDQADSNSDKSEKPLIVGVGGGTASGKSTIARRLRALGEHRHIQVIEMDNYYKAENADGNFDSPEALDLDRLIEDISKLSRGESILKPTYNKNSHRRGPLIHHPASSILIIEGVHALNKELISLLDYKIFVDTDEEVCKQRRKIRDLHELNRPFAETEGQWPTVWAMYVEHVAKHADIADKKIVTINDTELDDLAKLLFQKHNAKSS